MHGLVLFDSFIGLYQVLPLWARLELGAIAMKGYAAFLIAKASRLDCLVSYPGHSLRECYPSAEMQSVYSAAPADWATKSNGFTQFLKNSITIFVLPFLSLMLSRIICFKKICMHLSRKFSSLETAFHFQSRC